MYLFIFGCAASLLLHNLSLAAVSRELLLLWSVGFRCLGFSNYGIGDKNVFYKYTWKYCFKFKPVDVLNSIVRNLPSPTLFSDSIALLIPKAVGDSVYLPKLRRKMARLRIAFQTWTCLSVPWGSCSTTVSDSVGLWQVWDNLSNKHQEWYQ